MLTKLPTIQDPLEQTTARPNPMTDERSLELSVVVITRNEAANLPRLLAAVEGWADEVVVFDSGSTDGTVDLARDAGARVIDCEWEGWSATKNKANAAAKGKWILSLDADEVPDAASAQAIQDHMQHGVRTADGAWRVGEVNRLTQYCGHWVRHSGWHPDRKIRLWPAGAARWIGAIHEDLQFDGPVACTRLEGLVHHYSYHQRADHLAQIEKFGKVWAADQKARGRTTPLALVGLKVAAQWVKTYFLKGGFRDGRTGWTIARLSAWATWRKHARLRALHSAHPLTPQRILVSRTDALGDLVLTLPLVSALNRKFPNAEVHLLVRPYAVAVAKAALGVTEVHAWLPEHAADANGTGATYLRSLSFDAVVFAYPDRNVVKACRKARVGLRLGTGRRWHALGRMTHYNWDGRKDSGGHESWHGLRLLLPLGIDADGAFLDQCHLAVPIPDQSSVDLLEKLGGSPVLLHPGSHGSAGNWPAERFGALALQLAEKGHVVAFTGTEEEGLTFGAFLPEHPRIFPLFGQMDLAGLLFLQSEAEVVVASSTGPLHTAAAIGTPVVGLYGTRPPEWALRWRPIGPAVEVVETGIFLQDGSLDIPLEDVKEAVTAITGRVDRE